MFPLHPKNSLSTTDLSIVLPRILLLLALILPAALAAKMLTPGEALARLHGQDREPDPVNHRQERTHPDTGDFRINDFAFSLEGKDAPMAYVFSNPRAGFVILGADDLSAPLLGYSDREISGLESLPGNTRWWLSQYCRELEAAITIRESRPDGYTFAASPRNTATRTAIPPLCHTRWGQGSPYNDFCPLKDGRPTYSGCVATSMAQIMKAHQWPARGTGSHSYGWNGTTLSMDFSQQSFQWDAMTDTYPPESDGHDAAARDAVASLMKACGISVDMNYGTDGSGAYGQKSARALIDHFSYSNSTTLVDRRYFDIVEWEDMIYGSLSHGAPVIYMGTSRSGGHAFVCDGYQSNGFFHINWGWNGEADGYFLLSALNPYAQTDPSSGFGYNLEQKAVIEALPAGTDDRPLTIIANKSPLSGAYDAPGRRLSLSGQFCYFGSAPADILPGIKAVTEDGEYTIYSAPSTIRMEPERIMETISVTFDLPDEGDYTLVPVIRQNDTWKEIPASAGIPGYTWMTVKNGAATFKSNDMLPLEASDLTLRTPMYMGRHFELSYTITNPNDHGKSQQYYITVMSGDNIIWNWNYYIADLPAHGSQTVIFQEQLPFFSSTGKYRIGIFRPEGDGYTMMGEPAEAEIQIPPKGHSYSGENFVIEDSGAADPAAICFSLDLECLEGFYDYQTRAVVYDENNKEVLRRVIPGYDFVTEGETRRITHQLQAENLQGTGEYTLYTYANVTYSDTDDEYMPFLGSASFRLKQTGLGNPHTGDVPVRFHLLHDRILVHATEPILCARIYNLQGSLMPADTAAIGSETSIDIRGLTKGIYILRVTTADSTPATYRFIHD